MESDLGLKGLGIKEIKEIKGLGIKEMSNQMERLQNDTGGHNRSNEHREDHRSNREGSREKEYHSSSREGHHSSR